MSQPEDPNGCVVRATYSEHPSASPAIRNPSEAESIEKNSPISTTAGSGSGDAQRSRKEPKRSSPAPSSSLPADRNNTGSGAADTNLRGAGALERLSAGTSSSPLVQRARLDGGPAFKDQMRSEIPTIPCADSSSMTEADDMHPQSHQYDGTRGDRSGQTGVSDTENYPDTAGWPASETSTRKVNPYGTASIAGTEGSIAIAQARLVPFEDIPYGNEDTTETQPLENSSTRKAELSSNLHTSSRTRRKKMIILFSLIVLIAIVVGIVVGLVSRNNESIAFSQVGETISGNGDNTYLGTALALSGSGETMAVASPSMVQIYEFRQDDWHQKGQDIALDELGQSKSVELQGQELVSVAMNREGDVVVVGYDLATGSGLAQVYHYENTNNTWVPAGSALTGRNVVGDRFGASVAMNEDGRVIAVGAPGQDDDPGLVFIYQLDSNGGWGERGSPIVGENSAMVAQLGRSVSLSASGNRVATGARSKVVTTSDASTFFNVVGVYEYDFTNLEWNPLGKGINGVVSYQTTGWYVDLDASGNRLVVSNTYLEEADYVNTETATLFVQAVEFDKGVWSNFGERLHANFTGSKSGYVISYSDDGLTIAMGDRGTSEGGRSVGHAHIYKYTGEKWMQHGPDVEGSADGDNFGFAVALSGDGSRFAAGAPFNRAVYSDAGQVEVFDLE